MPTRVRLLRIAGLALSLALTAGCAEDARPPVRNHAPKQAYLITLTVENPPAPVTAIEGHASYQVMNDGDCLPRRPFFGGSAGAWYATEPVQFKPVSPNVWRAVVYADLYPDQSQTDDLGVCDWKFIAAGADFFIKGVDFAATLDARQILAELEEKNHYGLFWLAQSPPPKGRILGHQTIPDAWPPGTFSVVISSKELGR